MLDNLLKIHLKLLQIKKINKLIGNKIADKTTKVSNGSPQNSSDTVTNETKRKCIYLSPEKRQKVIDDLRLT